MKNKQGPKVLLIDIETAPMKVFAWGLFDQNIGLNQIETDWHLLSFSAKWLGDSDKNVIYMDQSKEKDITNDTKLLKKIWELMDECDIVLGQNSRKFDVKKINARFIMNGMPPPSPFRQLDTLTMAKKYFALTSNKLEYMSSKLCTKYKKLKDRKYSGFELWKACMEGKKDAWAEMKKYNKLDVLSLEELYNKFAPWDNSINFQVYTEKTLPECNCGSYKLQAKGYAYTSTGQFQRYRCLNCGKNHVGKVNLLDKEKRKSLLK